MFILVYISEYADSRDYDFNRSERGLLQLLMISELVVRFIIDFYDFRISYNAFNVVSL
jgi:hypothetical protein